MRTIRQWIAVIALFAAAAFAAAYLDPKPVELSGAAYIADGDTLQMDGERIRLWGIDAPELDQTCRDAKGENWYCGQRARAALRALVKDQTISCAPEGWDKYGRLLAMCWAGKREINSEMVAQGWAVAYGGYGAEQLLAQSRRKGIFAGSFTQPQAWRESKNREVSAQSVWDWIWSIAPD